MTNSLNVRRRFVVTTLSVLLLCLIAPLTAQAKDNWTSVRSKTFLLVGNASEKEMRQVATRLEQFRDVFTRLFSGARFTSPVPTTVIVFKSMNSYKPFNPGRGDSAEGLSVKEIRLDSCGAFLVGFSRAPTPRPD